LKTILAISTDLEDRKKSTAAWGQRGYAVIWTNTMCEAMTHLSPDKKFLFIGINEDNTDFWELLPTMRDTTETPIFIITSTYTTAKKVKALTMGADSYDPFAEILEENVQGALALLEARCRAIEKKENPIKILSHRNITMLPAYREVLIDDKQVKLSKSEFNVLYYFLCNRGITITFEQIYNCMHPETDFIYDDYVKNSIRNVVKRIRYKLVGQASVSTVKKRFFENTSKPQRNSTMPKSSNLSIMDTAEPISSDLPCRNSLNSCGAIK